MIKEIKRWPSKVLVSKSQAVEDYSIVSFLIEDMKDTMNSTNGIGISSSQVGSDMAVFIIDNTKLDDSTAIGNSDIFVAINPKIIDGYGEMIVEEGCLSFPGIFVKVLRAPFVVLEFDDILGKRSEISCTGMGAIAIQHEMDHLDGITLFDHATADIKRKIIESLNDAEEEENIDKELFKEL